MLEWARYSSSLKRWRPALQTLQTACCEPFWTHKGMYPLPSDCYVIEVLHTGNEYSGFNWNPPTFGATVTIGILAVIIAMMTVFQGALTAGPGRLKASSRAIGPVYYLKTRTEFRWLEFRFRTTAWVPYIDVLGWFDRLGEVQGPLTRHFKKIPRTVQVGLISSTRFRYNVNNGRSRVVKRTIFQAMCKLPQPARVFEQS